MMHSEASHCMKWMHCSVRPRNQQFLLGLGAAIILCTGNVTIAHPCVNRKHSKQTTQPFIFLPPPKILLMPPIVQTQLRTRAQKLVIVFIKIIFLCWHHDEEKRRGEIYLDRLRMNVYYMSRPWDTSIKPKETENGESLMTEEAKWKKTVLLVEYEMSPVGSCL